MVNKMIDPFVLVYLLFSILVFPSLAILKYFKGHSRAIVLLIMINLPVITIFNLLNYFFANILLFSIHIFLLFNFRNDSVRILKSEIYAKRIEDYYKMKSKIYERNGVID